LGQQVNILLQYIDIKGNLKKLNDPIIHLLIHLAVKSDKKADELQLKSSIIYFKEFKSRAMAHGLP
jgi:hypothetical protein